MTAPATEVPTLDWSKHQVLKKAQPCRICTRGALMTDETKTPCHKTCAEIEAASIARTAQ